MSKDFTYLDDVCEDYRVAILRIRDNRDEWRDLARRLAHVEIARREVADGIIEPTGPDFEDGCRTAVTDDELAHTLKEGDESPAGTPGGERGGEG